MQAVAAVQAPGFGQVLFRLQPADLDLRANAGVVGQYIQSQRAVRRLRQTHLDFPPGIEVPPFSQAQHTVDQLGLFRSERCAAELAAQADRQLRLWRRLRP
ncbi:hypothetical protein D3C78_1539940 [compost metagenome]